MTKPSLVELAGVVKTYPNGAEAVADCSLAIAPGEFVSLLGPSGCGKSTVLRMIAGLSAPTRGAVRRLWDDASMETGPPLGCVFQEPTLMPWASTWQNVYLPLRLRGDSIEAARSQVDATLELVGLDRFAGAYPAELSGGMKMRASVARALVTQPQLLLLDEPFAALDEISRMRLNDEIRDLWRRQQWAALFITHSVGESVYLSDRILVMSPRPGRVAAEIAVTLPADRKREIRVSQQYMDLCRQASSALDDAMAPSGGTT
jgi:NitT/TauT family transport system ATP-binding protein